MGRLFADPLGSFSEPSKTGYKVVDAGTGQWAAPDPKRKALDATPGWSAPELGPADISGMSWSQLQALSSQCASSNGAGYENYLGSTKSIYVSGVGTVETMIIGICHDTYSSGGKAGFTFQLRDGLSSTAPVSFQMNTSNTNSGGWNASAMRTTNLPKLLAALPFDLRGLIKKVSKKTSTANSGTSVSTTSDDLFLLSLVESIGTTKTAYSDNPVASTNYLYNEGTQYEYYEQFDGSRTDALSAHVIKNASGSANFWWLRSMTLSFTTRFYRMYTDGDWLNNVASNSRLPAAGFCL